MDRDDDALLMRIKRLEDMIESGTFVQAVPADGSNADQVSAAVPTVPKSSGKKVVLDRALPEDVKRICEEWNEIVNGTQDMLLKSVLKRAELTVSKDDTLMLGFKDQVYADQINDENNRKLLQSILNERIGREVEFETTLYKGDVRFDEQYADIMAILKIDKINTVEE
jgi:DNA polymerase-3 subunit gamma/tau